MTRRLGLTLAGVMLLVAVVCGQTAGILGPYLGYRFSAGPVLKTAQVSLSDAQIKALPTTPIQIVAAPGSAGKYIVVIKGSWKATTTSGAYTNINGTLAKLRLVYGANVTNASYEVADTGSPTEFTGLLGTAGVKITFLHNWKELPENFSNIDNLAVSVSIDNNGSGNLTGGHSSNSLVVTFIYLVVG